MGEARRRYSSQNGVVRTAIYDDSAPDTFRVKHSQDVEPILDSIARDQDIMSQSGDSKLAARIPTVIYEELQRNGIADDPDLFRAWLNGPEAAPWRIWRGRC